MTTFGQIHENADGYRKDFSELKGLCSQLVDEKAKGDPVVAWFRLRNRRIAQILDPMQNEIKSRINKDTQTIKEVDQDLSNITKAKTALRNNQIQNAQRLLRENGEIDVDFSSPDAAIDQLTNAEKELKKNRTLSTSNISYLRKASKNVTETKDLFSSTQKAKDIDHNAFSSAIATINHQRSTLDIDVPYLKDLPDTYDQSVIEDLHSKIRSVVARIDGRYPMKLFAPAIQVNRIIIHDVGNDRGRKAFTNRSAELDKHVNEAIDKFNGKYWQITGNRWERIGPSNRHGYRYVGSTHSKIKSI